MSKIIMDISSLGELVRILKMIKTNEEFMFVNRILAESSSVIESLILYDEIYIDENSIMLSGRPHIEIPDSLLEQTNIIKLYHTEEQIAEVEEVAKANMLSFLNKYDHMIIKLAEITGDIYHVPLFRATLPEPWLLKIFENRSWTYNKQATAILRYYYYMELKNVHQTDLLLSPHKQKVIQNIGFSIFLQENLGKAILDNIDETRKEKIKELQNEWFQKERIDFDLPMIINYIFQKYKSGDNLFDIIFDLKHSTSAENFRNAINELQKATIQNDQKLVADVLCALEDAKRKWNKDLKFNPTIRERRINVSMGYILSLGLDITFKDKKKSKNLYDDLLFFAHEMINPT